jgi:hypothetical protein
MNWHPPSRYAPKKTLVNRWAFVASILLLGSGCRVPLLNPLTLACLLPSNQQVDQPVAQSVSFVKKVSLETPTQSTEASLNQIDSEVSSYSQNDRSEVSQLPGDEERWNFNPLDRGMEELNLVTDKPWTFTPLTDAKTEPGDFQGLVEQDRPVSVVSRM